MTEQEILLPFFSTFHKKYTTFLSGIQRHFGEMQTQGHEFRQAQVNRALRKKIKAWVTF